MMSINKRSFEQDGFTVTVRHVSDDDADLSSLAPDSGNYDGIDDAERETYLAQDAERLADYHRGKWHYVGVVVDIRKQTTSHWADGGLVVGRASIWGIESDSEPAYFEEIERDTIAEAWAEVDRLRDALGLTTKNT